MKKVYIWTYADLLRAYRNRWRISKQCAEEDILHSYEHEFKVKPYWLYKQNNERKD